tara:strand:- start:139 stop:477 length:339 start_codon:yes stop_codon:yes gene_type:complete
MKNNPPISTEWFDESTLITDEILEKLQKRKWEPIVDCLQQIMPHSVSMKLQKLEKKIIMKNSIKINNTVELKDGRKVHSCGFGFNYWVETAKGIITPVSQKYFNKCLNSCRA